VVNGTQRLRSTSRDPRVFRLSPHGLNASSTYVVALRVKDGAGLASYARVLVRVKRGPLRVTVRGGDRAIGKWVAQVPAYHSAQGDIGFATSTAVTAIPVPPLWPPVTGVGDTLKLDGSGSVDTDTNSPSGLSYAWSCRRGGLAFGRPCGLVLSPDCQH
jgi:hypothetical protein